MKEIRNAYTILFLKAEWKRPVGVIDRRIILKLFRIYEVEGCGLNI
jgi:hypothetical protein